VSPAKTSLEAQLCNDKILEAPFPVPASVGEGKPVSMKGSMAPHRSYTRIARFAAILVALFMAAHYFSWVSTSSTPTKLTSSPVELLAKPRINDAGQEYFEFDPFELPRLLSPGEDAPEPGNLRIAVLEHALFHDGEQTWASVGRVRRLTL